MAPIKNRQGIAIVGLSCRFPQAMNAEAFWRLIAQGKSVFQPMPQDRKLNHILDPLERIIGGFLEEPYHFDNQYFNISDSEALFMDPQHRIVLELAVEALEDAGYAEWRNQPIGVFVGANQRAYMETISSKWYRNKVINYLRLSEEFQQIPGEFRSPLEEKMELLSENGPLPPHTLIGNLTNMIPSRVAHELDLKGPAIAVDTACSSSLVAVHLACESLYQKECDLALAGGINLNLTPTVFQFMHAAGVISPTAKCIPFSKKSDGILLGEGAGLVTLKRLEDALRDQDPIWAVIKGSGINNDGHSLGLMAPAWKGQLALLQNTYARSGFAPANISAIEAHGTSTRIGDGVELSVIEKFFPLNPDKPISVGSVKSNIGHTLGTAGIAGLIKMILAIKHGQLPPTIHEEIDPAKKLLEKGIRIQSNLMDWQSDQLRSAAVSSFGFGGTNAHLILQEPENLTLARPAPKTIFSRKRFYYDFFPSPKSSYNNLAQLHWCEQENWLPKKSFNPKYWLLFTYEANDLLKLKAYLKEKGLNCYGVDCLSNEKDTDFVRKDQHHFQINPGNPDHYNWLLEGFSIEDEIGVLFIGNGVDKALNPIHFIHRELSAFRCLAHALNQRENTKIWVVTFNAFQIEPVQKVNPQQRALATLAAGIFEEQPNLRGALVDLNYSDDHREERIFQILGAIGKHPWVVRGKQYFVPELQSIKRDKVIKHQLAIKPGGTYLVMGGSSGVGALIAEHLAKLSGGKVVVTGTRPQEQLPEQLQALIPHQIDYMQSSAIAKQDIEYLIREVHRKYDHLDGIVYAAGRISFGTLIKKRQEDFEKTILAKMAGVHYLAEVLKGNNPDFVFLVSSISSLSPAWAAGIADYAAANAFLDAFAMEKNSETVAWISCSWGLWENTGMGLNVSNHFTGFSPEEGLKTFDDALALGIPHILALPLGQHSEFTTQFSEKKNRESYESAKPLKPTENEELASRPIPTPVIKREIDFAGLMKRYIAETVDMKVEAINEEASFYDLGLDSLSAVDVVQKMEAETGLNLHPTLLFEYDTISSLSTYLETIQHKGKGKAEPKTAKTEPEIRSFPLIGAQKTFFAQQQFYPDIPCNMMVNLRIDQQFNLEQLQRAWNKLEEKHDSLRLNFAMTDHGPMQTVSERTSTPIEFRNCANRAEVLAFEDELINHVFDLANPPFFRLACVEWKPGTTTIMLAMHHLIGDAWSMYILLKDLLEAYTGTLEKNGEMTSPGTAFRDYVLYKKSSIPNKDLLDLKNYWTQNLNNIDWSLPLPYRKPAGKRGQFRMLTGVLSPSATKNLMRENQDRRLSAFHTMLAAFFLTLHQETGREDFIIRIANANRDANYPKIKTLTGCLADALPLRIKIQQDQDLLSVAQAVKKQVLEALKFTGLSSQDIAELPIGRPDAGPVVLSPVGMSFVPMHHLAKKSMPAFSEIRCRTALPFTDISLICFIENDALKTCWNYDEAVFEAQSIHRFINRFIRLLGGSDLDSYKLPPLELPKEKLFPDIPLLHEKVWEACRLYEQRNAIVSEEDSLSYKELALKSKQVAISLTNHLSSEEKTVGILAYPGIHAVVGILGILASGRAFIPLDPDWPDGRIETILNHSKVKTIVTTSSFLHRFDSQISHPHKRLLLLDKVTGPIQTGEEIKIVCLEEPTVIERLDFPKTKPQSLAYVMYTSGTSGRPKGVMVSHQTVAVFLNWISETFQINERDRFIHTSSLGFGGSIRQIFSTLLAGATLFPIKRQELKDPESLFYFLEKNQITLLNTVPSVINNLLEWVELSAIRATYPNPLSHLRFLLLGGDSLHAETVIKWKKHFGNYCTIANLYGSTETIVNATAFFISSENDIDSGAVSIGYQKKGSLVRLLNEQGELCPLGETGQIYVGGPCLADGYYREPELTAQKFVTLDLKESKGRFYSTGDLAYMDETGRYFFVGRNDDQIQIHGNRVELTEIENTIYQTQQVKHTAVVDLRLEAQHWVAAFVELNKTGLKLTAQQIRQFIGQRLPAYMVPHKVILLEQMPLNQAGKTDRLALRRLLSRELIGEEEQGKETIVWKDTEKVIAEVWKKLLRLKELSPADDFFDLGGDSILALLMLHELRKHFKIVPKAVSLFKHSKLQSLAATIAQLNATEESGEARKPKPEMSSNINIVSPSQRGFILLEKLFPKSAPNWAGLLHLHGNLDPDLLKKAFDFLLYRHPMLRTVFVNEGGKTWQKILEIDHAPMTYFDLCHHSREEQQGILLLALTTLQKTEFKFSKYPLFKVQLYKTGEKSGVLAICMHHIITDGWSTQILINDLLRTYDYLMDGKKPDLGPSPPLYAEATNLLLERASGLHGAALDKPISFWKKTLADLPAFVPPSDTDPRRSVPVRFILSEKVKKKLHAWSKDQGVTLYNTLLAISARSISRLYDLDSLLINTAVNGRDLPIDQIQEIVGCFARNLPLRISLDQGATLSEDVKRVVTSFVDALEHQEIPPTELFKIATDQGDPSSVFAINRFYFSFMDFSALASHSSQNLSLLWDESIFAFSAGGAGSEIMLGVNVSGKISVNLNGYASTEMKEQLQAFMMEEIHSIIGEVQTIDAALIAYLPSSAWLKQMLPDSYSTAMINDWKNRLLPHDQPKLLERTLTHLGVSGLVFLPVNSEELSLLSPEQITQKVLSAIQVARNHGAKQISLAGMLPSLTNYGFSVLKSLEKINEDVKSTVLTSGHACTVVAVVKTIQKVLDLVAARLDELKVVVFGFGSIGQSALSLLLKAQGQPLELIIVDQEKQLPHLLTPLADLKNRYSGKLTIQVVKRGEIPDDIYTADLIIGASSSGQVLDVNRFREGAILVDDSFPSVIDIREGINRMKQSKDVLFIGGGKLNFGNQKRHILATELPEAIVLPILRNLGEEGMPGCRVESLVLNKIPTLPPIIGLADEKTVWQYWERMDELEINAASLHLGGFQVRDELIKNVKDIILAHHNHNSLNGETTK